MMGKLYQIAEQDAQDTALRIRNSIGIIYTSNDLMMHRNGFINGYRAALAEVQRKTKDVNSVLIMKDKIQQIIEEL